MVSKSIVDQAAAHVKIDYLRNESTTFLTAWRMSSSIFKASTSLAYWC